MTFSRRVFTFGAAGLVAVRQARAQGSAEPIRLGQIPALTGPSSSPGIGFNRGVEFATAAINAAGGVKGRMVEIITRDTQGDPTKAVNAVQGLISSSKVHAIWGPVNSGEALATTPIMARAKMPNLHPCVVDSLIDAAKFPNAFRMAPANGQWTEATSRYLVDILKVREIVALGDTTGYGTTAVAASVTDLKTRGATVTYQALIEASQPDVTADMLRAKNSGAKAVLVWTVSAGYLGRLLNARAQLNWDVPFVGHPALGSGEVRQLLTKPENWDRVFQVGYRSCSFEASGKLPPRQDAFVRSLAGKVSLSDTSLWWVACGVDAVNLVAKAVEETGSSDSPAIIGHWNKLQKYPGLFGDYTFSPQEHNGYPTGDVVMSVANSFRDGAFAIAPGY